MAKADLTAQRLREIMEYDADTGIFVWRCRTGKSMPGTVAGTVGNGYVQICVEKTRTYAHRLAWLYMTGNWPEFHIDHIDGNKANNRWTNLRDVTRSLNNQNRKGANVTKDSCKLLGAYRSRDHWMARIKTDDVTFHLGVFPTAEEAHSAYIEAKRRLHPGCTL